MKALLIGSLLIASGAVMAEQSLLEGVAKQEAKNTAATVAPGAVERAEAADQALKDAKQVKDAVQNAPEAAKDQAQKAVEGTVKQQLEQATPKEIKEGAEAVKSGKETAKKLEGEVKALPKSSSQEVKKLKHKSTAKAKQKGTEKALELLK